MQQLLAIAVGGALGSVMRFQVSLSVYGLVGRDFPYGTLAVNVLGSFFMGLVFILLVERGMLSSEWRNVIMIGFLGAFTTFSTFSIETIALLESGEFNRALLNIALSVVVCLGATWLGLILGRQI